MNNCLINDRFICHYSNNSWGDEVLIMEKSGLAFARAYWFNDDEKSIYLNWLSVSESARKQGIGTELQIIREEIGRKIGASCAYLQVEKDTWMHNWYKRRGYKDYKRDDNGLIWMKKSLIISKAVTVESHNRIVSATEL